MNKQKKYDRDGNLKSRGIEWTDYTWNPVAGCHHGCEWQMPDGSVASCYADDVATGIASAAYPHGFDHHYYHPTKLADPQRVKSPARIFTGSMADVFGHWVPEQHIEDVLLAVHSAPRHTFQLLTKNAVRTKKFDMPPNAWVGASSPPDFMWGRRLSRHQQNKMLSRTLTSLQQVSVPVRWMSFEPLSWDVSHIVRAYPGVLQWAVIGAASNGRKTYAPNERHVVRLVAELDAQGIPVFFKGNLESLPWASKHWREEFPTNPQATTQRSLF